MLAEIYNKVDNGLMYGVNKTVQAWNWATGRTKSDLAIGLSWAGSTLLVANEMIMLDSIPRNIFLPGTCLYPFVFHANARMMDKIEELASEVNAISPVAEVSKINYKSWGPIWAGMGVFVSMSPENPSLAIPCFPMAGAQYIMRADSLPPRKDCIRRGLEKLTKAIDKNSVPVPQPIPIEAGLISPNYLFQ